MKKFTLIIFFLSCAGILNSIAQNLVVNPGLDYQLACPLAGEIANAIPWNSPTSYAADLMNDTCPSQNMAARTGHGCAGIYTYNGVADQRQYIQGQLSSPLVAGQLYDVSFWVHRIDNHWASNMMGAYFSVGAVNQTIMTNISVTPQISHTSGALNSPVYEEVSGTFMAAGGEDHILIGNFYPDFQTTLYIAVASSPVYTAYYLIDDVSVESVSGTGIADPKVTAAAIKLFPQPAAGEVTIQYPPSLQIQNIELTDASGRQIIPIPIGTTFAGRPGEIRLQPENILPGIYFLTIRMVDAVINKKIVFVGT
jgi:hypothetical protein